MVINVHDTLHEIPIKIGMITFSLKMGKWLITDPSAYNNFVSPTCTLRFKLGPSYCNIAWGAAVCFF
jgi:hypothetical protein